MHSRGYLSHLRETMTSALVPSRESWCVGQLCLSRNGSVLPPRVPCACVKPTMFGSTCSSLPCCPQACGHPEPLTVGFPVLNEANGQLRKCACAQAPRCHHQCFLFRLWASSFSFLIVSPFFCFVFNVRRLVLRASSADYLGFLR